MNRTPRITTVICTHNRARYLKKALEGLRTQTLPTDQYEILVVDNRSTDETQEVVTQAQEGLPNLRYCYEEELGNSAARNCGVRNACGEYLAFLDDDAIPGQEWLQAALSTFDNDDPTLGLVGGKVIPIWERERPKWLPDELLPYLTVVDLGDQIREVKDVASIVCANMIMPRRVFQQTTGFSTKLGRKGNNLLSNEEVALHGTLQEAGFRAVYNPDVKVWHHIHAERIEKRWLLRRLYWQGRSDVVWQKLREQPRVSKSLLRVARATVFTFRAGWRAYGRPDLPAAERFYHKAKAYEHLGQSLEHLKGKL